VGRSGFAPDIRIMGTPALEGIPLTGYKT